MQKILNNIEFIIIKFKSYLFFEVKNVDNLLF